MSLTVEQRETILAAVRLDPVLSVYLADGNLSGVADGLNLKASPAFWVWRTSVSPSEWRQAILGGGGATQLDALTASKRDSLLWALNDILNPSLAAVRAALDDFCGSQNTLKASILAAEKRTATVAEKILATGTGSEASPATASFEGFIDYTDLLG